MAEVPEAFWAIEVGLRVTLRNAFRSVEARGESVTNKRVRAALVAMGASCQNQTISDVVRWHKQGRLPERWDAAPGDGGQSSGAHGGRPSGSGRQRPASGESCPSREALADLIEASSTEEDLDEVNKVVSKMLAVGTLEHREANSFKQLLAERRLVLKAAREAPTDDPELQFTLTESACKVARAFERICSDDIRQEVVDLVCAALERDMAELPAVDPQGAL